MCHQLCIVCFFGSGATCFWSIPFHSVPVYSTNSQEVIKKTYKIREKPQTNQCINNVGQWADGGRENFTFNRKTPQIEPGSGRSSHLPRPFMGLEEKEEKWEHRETKTNTNYTEEKTRVSVVQLSHINAERTERREPVQHMVGADWADISPCLDNSGTPIRGLTIRFMKKESLGASLKSREKTCLLNLNWELVSLPESWRLSNSPYRNFQNHKQASSLIAKCLVGIVWYYEVFETCYWSQRHVQCSLFNCFSLLDCSLSS